MSDKNFEELSFEDAMERLGEIVAELEKGDAPLESSLEIFEDGVKLTKLCSEKLAKATQKVTLLTANGEEDFKAESVGE